MKAPAVKTTRKTRLTKGRASTAGKAGGRNRSSAKDDASSVDAVATKLAERAKKDRGPSAADAARREETDTMTIEERLRRAMGLAAVLQQATIGTNGIYPDHFHEGVAELADLLGDDLTAIKRALPTEAINREAPEP